MGFDAAREPNQLRRQIGVVFQAQSIDVKLTAAENLWHQGHLYGLRGAALKSRIVEMLGRVGLADRAKEKAETFSGGMQRRLELAKGLLHHPAVLLLDEPTTGLDPGARRDLWQYLQILRDEEKVTVIVTTHLMEEAERCDRLAILNEGKLVALGTPSELKREIGGDVILLDARDAESLAERIRARFNLQAQVLGGQVRLERENGHRFITDVVEAFPGEIEAISVSKPSLEDVFIHRTGHKFWTEDAEPIVAPASRRLSRRRLAASGGKAYEFQPRLRLMVHTAGGTPAGQPARRRRYRELTYDAGAFSCLRTHSAGRNWLDGRERNDHHGGRPFHEHHHAGAFRILFLNVYLEARKKFAVKKAPPARKSS